MTVTLLEEQKYYTQLAVECIPSKTLRDFLHAKTDFVLPTLDMMALGAMSAERTFHQKLDFLIAMRGASFLTELDKLYLENEIDELIKSEESLFFTHKHRALVAVGRQKNWDDKEIGKYGSLQECLDDLKNKNALSEYVFVSVTQYKKSTRKKQFGNFNIDENYKPINVFSNSHYLRQSPELLQAIEEELKKENGVFLGAHWHELPIRYVRLPVPFKKGDVIKRIGYDDELYVVAADYVINERLIKIVWDDSDMVLYCLPVEYKDRIRQNKEDEFTQDDWNEHDHLSVLYVEMVESWNE